MNDLWCWFGAGPSPARALSNTKYLGVECGVNRFLAQTVTDQDAECATSHSGNYRIVLDGSLHNTYELLSALRGTPNALGPDEQSHAAILLAVMLEWGPAGLDLVNGMFAFLVWDEYLRRVTLGRDRFGMKTLYWSESVRGMAIASRMHPILNSLASRRTLDLEATLDFLINGFTDQGDLTLFEGVRQLPAGCVMEIDVATWLPGGSSSVTTKPPPASLAAVAVPPCTSNVRRVIASPNPVRSGFDRPSVRIRLKGTNKVSMLSSGTPGP